MGVGFNSIYHITDLPSFINGDKYVILDPHKWCYDSGEKFNFVKNKLTKEYPNLLESRVVNHMLTPFKGIIFPYI